MARKVLNLLLLAAIATVSTQLLGQAFHRANVRADIQIVARESHLLLGALDKYFSRHGAYPSSYSQAAFDLDSLDPLRSRGYYNGYLTTKLFDNRVDAYGSPDDRGQDQEFWIEMSLASDPTVRFLIVRSDDAPLGGGQWHEGVFLVRAGRLESI